MRKLMGIGLLFVGLLFFLSLAPMASAQDDCPLENVWTGAISTAWNVAENWSCGVVPATTNVTIPASAAPNFPVVPSPGLIFVNNMTVEAGASFDLNGASVIFNGALVNNGTLIDRRPVNTVEAAPEFCFFCFGGYQGLFLSRDEGVGGDPGIVEVKISGNQGTCDTGNSTIGRCFEITPTNSENISLDAIFYFQPGELNGLTCEQLNAFHWTDNGWEAAGSHNSVDCESSTSPDYAILTDDIRNFSYFVGAPGTPTAVELLGFSVADSGNGLLSVMVFVALFVAMMLAVVVWRRRKLV